jgi:hypothetical protein
VCKSVELRECCHEFLKEYKENGLERVVSAATKLANDLQVEPESQSVKRLRLVKRYFHYEAHDEQVMTPENSETESFNTLLDTALMSIKERSEKLRQHAGTWSLRCKLANFRKNNSL